MNIAKLTRKSFFASILAAVGACFGSAYGSEKKEGESRGARKEGEKEGQLINEGALKEGSLYIVRARGIISEKAFQNLKASLEPFEKEYGVKFMVVDASIESINEVTPLSEEMIERAVSRALAKNVIQHDSIRYGDGVYTVR